MFGLVGPEHVLIQEWKFFHHGRAHIEYQNDIIKSAVTLHTNQATHIAPCPKDASATWHTSTRRCRHRKSLSRNQWWILAAGKAYNIGEGVSWCQQQIFQHAAYFSARYRQIFDWQTAECLPPVFSQLFRNWALLGTRRGNISIRWGPQHHLQ